MSNGGASSVTVTHQGGETRIGPALAHYELRKARGPAYLTARNRYRGGGGPTIQAARSALQWPVGPVHGDRAARRTIGAPRSTPTRS